MVENLETRYCKEEGRGARSELDAVHESVHTLIRSIETMSEELQARRDRFGFSSMQMPARLLGTFAPIVARLTGT
jgi:hypothetical protein